MKFDLRYTIIILLMIYSNTYAQTKSQFNGKLNIFFTGNSSTYDYEIKGTFSNDGSGFFGNNIAVGDRIIDGTCRMYIVEEVLDVSASPIVFLAVTDPETIKKAPTHNHAIIYRPTQNLDLPLITSGLSEDMKECVTNHLSLSLDDNVASKSYVDNSISIADGSETKITPGNNSNITGSGTTDDPYIINSTDTDDQSLSEVLTVDTDAGGQQITNLGAPIADNDAATKEYVDDNTIEEMINVDRTFTKDISAIQVQNAKTYLQLTKDEISVKEFLVKVFFPKIVATPPTIPKFVYDGSTKAVYPYSEWKLWGVKGKIGFDYTVKNESKDDTTDDTDISKISLVDNGNKSKEYSTAASIDNSVNPISDNITCDMSCPAATVNSTINYVLKVEDGDNVVYSNSLPVTLQKAIQLQFNSFKPAKTTLDFSRTDYTLDIGWDINKNDESLTKISTSTEDVNPTTNQAVSAIGQYSTKFTVKPYKTTNTSHTYKITATGDLYGDKTTSVTVTMNGYKKISWAVAPSYYTAGGTKITNYTWEYENNKQVHVGWNIKQELNPHDQVTDVKVDNISENKNGVNALGTKMITMSPSDPKQVTVAANGDLSGANSLSANTPTVTWAHRVYRGVVDFNPCKADKSGTILDSDDIKTNLQLKQDILGGNWSSTSGYVFDGGADGAMSYYFVFAFPDSQAADNAEVWQSGEWKKLNENVNYIKTTIQFKNQFNYTSTYKVYCSCKVNTGKQVFRIKQ